MSSDDREDIYEKWRPNRKWFSILGVDENNQEEKKDMIKRVLSVKPITDVVKKHVEDEINSSYAQEESIEDLECASWSKKAAWRAGERAALRRIKKFLP